MKNMTYRRRNYCSVPTLKFFLSEDLLKKYFDHTTDIEEQLPTFGWKFNEFHFDSITNGVLIV